MPTSLSDSEIARNASQLSQGARDLINTDAASARSRIGCMLSEGSDWNASLAIIWECVGHLRSLSDRPALAKPSMLRICEAGLNKLAHAWTVTVTYNNGQPQKSLDKQGRATRVRTWALMQRNVATATLAEPWTRSQWHRVYGHAGRFDARS